MSVAVKADRHILREYLVLKRLGTVAVILVYLKRAAPLGGAVFLAGTCVLDRRCYVQHGEGIKRESADNRFRCVAVQRNIERVRLYPINTCEKILALTERAAVDQTGVKRKNEKHYTVGKISRSFLLP